MNFRFVAWIRLQRRVIIRNSSSSFIDQKNPFERLWSKYLKLLNDRPVLTKCITSGILSFTADFICQRWEMQRAKGTETAETTTTTSYKDFDWLRALRFTFLGAGLVAPVLHVWYGFLARFIPGPLLVDAMKRLVLDQLLFAPAFIPVFFSANLLLEGKPEMIEAKIKKDLWSTVITNYAVWIPAQFINFRIIPPNLQVLFSNFVGFFWNIYFSYAANRQLNSQQADVSEDRLPSENQQTITSDVVVAHDSQADIARVTDAGNVQVDVNVGAPVGSVESVGISVDVMDDKVNGLLKEAEQQPKIVDSIEVVSSGDDVTAEHGFGDTVVQAVEETAPTSPPQIHGSASAVTAANGSAATGELPMDVHRVSDSHETPAVDQTLEGEPCSSILPLPLVADANIDKEEVSQGGAEGASVIDVDTLKPADSNE